MPPDTLAVKMAVPPVQIVWLGRADTEGVLLTVTVVDVDAVQPLTVTLKVAVCVPAVAYVTLTGPRLVAVAGVAPVPKFQA